MKYGYARRRQTAFRSRAGCAPRGFPAAGKSRAGRHGRGRHRARTGDSGQHDVPTTSHPVECGFDPRAPRRALHHLFHRLRRDERVARLSHRGLLRRTPRSVRAARGRRQTLLLKEPSMKRLHIHIAVDDLEKSIGFYLTLFASKPSVRKEDYAKWMLDDPRVNLAISQRERAASVDHLGIQTDTDAE